MSSGYASSDDHEPTNPIPVDRPWAEFLAMMPTRLAPKPKRKRYPCVWDDPVYLNMWQDRNDLTDAVEWVRRLRGKAPRSDERDVGHYPR